MTCSPDLGRGILYRLVLTHSLQLLRTTNLFLQSGLTEAKPDFLLVLSSKLNSSAKTEVSLFITEVPPPTIPPSRIDCCLTVRFFLAQLSQSWASPLSKILIDALTSRSWCALQNGQSHSRTDSGFLSVSLPHFEQIRLVYAGLTLMRIFPYFLHLYSSMSRNLPQLWRRIERARW